MGEVNGAYISMAGITNLVEKVACNVQRLRICHARGADEHD